MSSPALPKVEVPQWFVAVGTMGAVIPAATKEDAAAIMLGRIRRPPINAHGTLVQLATEMHARYLTEGVWKPAQCEDQT